MAAAQAAVEAGRAGEVLARVRSRLNPELAVQLRQERDAYGEAWGNRIALLVTVPLGSRAVQREQLAVARAGTEAAQALVAATDRGVRGGFAQAQEARQAALAIQRSTEGRFAALVEQTRLVESAWRGGQTTLIEVIRARAMLAEADEARLRARVASGRALSGLNQASGAEPS